MASDLDTFFVQFLTPNLSPVFSRFENFLGEALVAPPISQAFGGVYKFRVPNRLNGIVFTMNPLNFEKEISGTISTDAANDRKEFFLKFDDNNLTPTFLLYEDFDGVGLAQPAIVNVGGNLYRFNIIERKNGVVFIVDPGNGDPLIHEALSMDTGLRVAANIAFGLRFEEIANIVRCRFEKVVQPSLPAPIPVQYDNASFDQPETGIWARLSIDYGVGAQVATGSRNRFRHPGTVIIQLFGPILQGDQAHLEIADLIVAAYKSQIDSGITFRTPFVRTVGTGGKEWQMNIFCPFLTDNIAG